MDITPNNWSGGTTYELYRDNQDFNIRVSCAYIDIGNSTFSDFSGYNRILTILEGVTSLEVDETPITLSSKDTLTFTGDQHVSSKNSVKVLDFNIIYKESHINLDFSSIKEVGDHASYLVLSLFDNTKLLLTDTTLFLNKYDFIILEDRPHLNRDVLVVGFTKKA